MIIIGILAAAIGWLIGINFVWWVQAIIFISFVVWMSKKEMGLEGIPAIAAGWVMFIAMAVADLVYIIKYPHSVSWLKSFGSLFVV